MLSYFFNNDGRRCASLPAAPRTQNTWTTEARQAGRGPRQHTRRLSALGKDGERKRRLFKSRRPTNKGSFLIPPTHKNIQKAILLAAFITRTHTHARTGCNACTSCKRITHQKSKDFHQSRRERMSEIFSKDESEGYSLISAHLSLSFKTLEESSTSPPQRRLGGGKNLFTSHAALCGLSLLVFSRGRPTGSLHSTLSKPAFAEVITK